MGASRRKVGLLILLAGVVGVTAYQMAWPLLDAGARQRRAAEQAMEQRDFQAAHELVKQGLASRPQDLDLRLLAAQTARRLGQFDEAEQHLEFYQRKNGNLRVLELEHRLLRLQRGELAEADKLLTACADRPHDAETPLILEAIIEGNLRIFDQAFTSGVVFEGARASTRMAKLHSAVAQWQQQRGSVVDRVQALIWSSHIYFFSNDYSRAVGELRAAVELAPDHFEARRQLAGRISQEAPLETVFHFERLRRRHPHNNDVLYGLAAVRRNLGELDEARRLLDELLASEPEYPGALLERGKVAQDLGQLDEAETILRRVLERQTRDPEANLALSRCLFRAGKDAEAQGYRDRFQKYESDRQRQRDELIRKHVTPRQ